MSRIAIIAENSVAYVETVLKIWNQGDSAVLIDWRIPPATILELLSLAEIQACYTDIHHYEELKKTLNLPVEQISTHQQGESIPDDVRRLFHEDYGNREAVVFFSSGTTGTSKGISLTHNAINTNADAIIAYMELSSSDVIYIVRALAYSSTLVGELLVGLKSGVSVFISRTLTSPTKTLDNIGKIKATILCANPTLISLYIMVLRSKDYNLFSLRSLYSAGAKLNQTTMEDARKLFKYSKVYNSYGLTEAGPRVCAQTKENYDLAGTVGKPVQNVSVIIVDDQNIELPCHQPGFILVRTPSCYTKYIVKKSDNPIPGNNEYIRTGDMGYKDENGNIYITGRADDMIIKGSHNVFPESVEEVILLYPAIKDCLVFGRKDAIYGQSIICLFVPQLDNITSENLRAHCAAHLADYEIPAHFIAVTSLPLTTGGKKSRFLAQQLYTQELGKGGQT